MDAFDGLMHGLGVVLTFQNLTFAFVGCLVGMMVGVLPGVGQSAGMAILIPITYSIGPTGAIIMLASIFYGAYYGGRITSILLNVPGESESVVTTFDGYPLARQGKAGTALGISAIASFVGGVFATFVLLVTAIPLSRLALALGPPEYFALLLLSLSLVAGLLGKSVVKGLIMVVLGLLLSQIGMDPALGTARLTMGQTWLLDGIPLLALIMGFFGVSDTLMNVFERRSAAREEAAPVDRLLPTRQDMRESATPMARGAVIGFLLGMLPGMAAAVSTFASYIVEKRVSRTPEKFGHGAIPGIAGPETANNAFANASFLPLITLGIPGSASLAILFGAFMIHGIAPGPAMFRDYPDVAWGLIASMIVGNVILLTLSLPLSRVWIYLLRVPATVLGAIIVTVSMIGMYSLSRNPTDLAMLAAFTLFGAGLKVAHYPLPPTVLAFILGPLIEASLRQSLLMSGGDGMIFFTRPISATLLGMALLLVLLTAASGLRGIRVRRETLEA